MPKVQNYRRQTVQKQVMPKTQMPKPPEIPAEPGKQDKLCKSIFFGGLSFGALLLVGSSYFLSQGFVSALKHSPIEWLTVVGLTVTTVVLGFVLRGIIWASFAGVAMLASQLQAFHAQEFVCALALKYKKFFPGSTAWASQGKMAMMANRQQWKELIAFGSTEYEATKKKDQNLAPLCAYIGMAQQIQGDPHSAIVWNERAVEYFQQGMESFNKVTPDAKVPNREFVDNIIMQHASAYANLGSNYFAVNNFGKAKKNLSTALEVLGKVKDSPQKDMLVKGINEHLARLKHW